VVARARGMGSWLLNLVWRVVLVYNVRKGKGGSGGAEGLLDTLHYGIRGGYMRKRGDGSFTVVAPYKQEGRRIKGREIFPVF